MTGLIPGAEGERAAPAGAARPRGSPLLVLLDTPARRVEAVVIVLVLTIGLGVWVYRGVKDSLRELRATSLQTLVDSEAVAIDAWIEKNRTEAQQWSRDPVVRDAVVELSAMARAGASPAALREAPARGRLLEALAPLLADNRRVAVKAVDRSGEIVASLVPDYVGLYVGPDVAKDLAPVFAGRAEFLAPRAEEERLLNSPVVAYPRPIVWFMAPIGDDRGEAVAAFGFGVYADARFSAILGTASLGASGEAYAFDRDGRMLSESRFASDVPRNGAAHGDLSGRPLLRDPGDPEDTDGEPRQSATSPRPLTALAQAAITGGMMTDPGAHRGVLVEPYRNYRGVEVVGAWRWLPDHGIGIGVEVGATEAYAPLRYLTFAFWAVLALAMIGVGVAVLSWLFAERAWREGRHLGPYRIGERIGEGGAATVYRATHALLKRPTAVKILKPHMTADEVVARFEREVQLASRLTHPSAIEIYDFGRARDGSFYYAMEYLDGVTLAELVERDGPLPPGRAAHVLKRVCEALREAHGQGLIHRDIKPQNVMLCQRGGDYDVVKVLDFGLAKDLYSADTRDITQYARVLGTPLYMAPERIGNPAVADALTDLYSVGALAFNLLAGRPIFTAATAIDLEREILESTPPRVAALAGPAIPAELDHLVAKLLAKDPRERPQSADEVIEVLTAVLATHPWHRDEARRWWQEFYAARAAAA
ncbi:MAG: serine/threonine protein kinase [Burkholderiales bacterium]|jgi:serine/threonine-protein kinase|nr:serine/threonine protein kinase [Burkholderiales bacterium]